MADWLLVLANSCIWCTYEYTKTYDPFLHFHISNTDVFVSSYVGELCNIQKHKGHLFIQSLRNAIYALQRGQPSRGVVFLGEPELYQHISVLHHFHGLSWSSHIVTTSNHLGHSWQQNKLILYSLFKPPRFKTIPCTWVQYCISIGCFWGSKSLMIFVNQESPTAFSIDWSRFHLNLNPLGCWVRWGLETRALASDGPHPPKRKRRSDDNKRHQFSYERCLILPISKKALTYWWSWAALQAKHLLRVFWHATLSNQCKSYECTVFVRVEADSQIQLCAEQAGVVYLLAFSRSFQSQIRVTNVCWHVVPLS